MPRFETVAGKIRDEIMTGRHGGEMTRFLTVRDVAAEYGISVSTAQKTMRLLKEEGFLIGDATNPPFIAPESQWKIDRTKKGRPSPRRLGLVVTDITLPFFNRLCRFVQDVAGELGYQTLVASSNGELNQEKRIIDGFLSMGIEGLLACPGLDDGCSDYYRDLLAKGVKIIFISRRLEDVECDSVVAHNFVGGASVAGHFISMGYESFGYISFGHRLKRDERFDGFRSALIQQGVDLGVLQVTDGDGGDRPNGYQAMERLLEKPTVPRAVFAYSDQLAIGAMHCCQAHGLSVPHDIAIAGFDNLPEARVTTPPLTSIDYPIEMIAKIAVENLMSTIAKPSERRPTRIFLEPHLVVRGSTDPSWKPTLLQKPVLSDTTPQPQETDHLTR